ncbi:MULTISPECIES: hypothetical protein [Neisseria]|uniref:hypothetical protein n=1 Tax=Neisseria TaxID=482 RepID=UPI001104DE37|nr:MULTISPECIES: hypothetical protein [Neisseria]MBF0804403.1 hypothetical protein [Neisseria sp. 19428wB4_WF04]TFU42831.1 hypothetical protein E4T99_08635 [Neisseria sp. WF04]
MKNGVFPLILPAALYQRYANLPSDPPQRVGTFAAPGRRQTRRWYDKGSHAATETAPLTIT